MSKTRFLRKECRIPPQEMAPLRECCAAWGVTLSTLFLTAYAEVLAGWSRDSHFTLNLTTDLRPAGAAMRNVVGCFSSFALLECDLGGFESFESRARKLHHQLLEVLDHVSVDGLQLTRELALMSGSTDGRSPPVVFTAAPMQRDGESTSIFDTLRNELGQIVHRASQTPQVWLDCQVWWSEDAAELSWDFVDGLFPEGVIDDMFTTFQKRIQDIARSPASRSRRAVDLLPGWQRQLIRRVNDTGADPAPASLYEPFVARARAQPDAVALICEARSMTYAELHDAALRTSAALQAKGIGRGDIIGIVSENTEHSVAAILGVLALGAAYLPVSPSWPTARRQRILAAADARATLVPAADQDGRGTPLSPLHFEPLDGPLATPADRLDSATADELGYIIFTSGSTGEPKGVRMSHAAASNTVADINRRFDVSPQDKVLAISAPTFDLSVYDIFGTLSAGGTLVLPPSDGRQDAAAWLECCRKTGVTLLNAVPSQIERLIAEAERASLLLPAVRLVLLSGDWIAPGLPRRLRQQCPNAVVMSLGGATEAGIWSIHYPITSRHAGIIPYGKPLSNQRVHILLPDGGYAPVHVAGDLHISGASLALGYHSDPQATAAAFTLSPLIGERLYRTGDVARLMPDGNVELLGREDSQFKRNGVRVDLRELESTLSAFPEVRNAIALVFKGTDARPYVACWMVACEPVHDQDAFISRIRAELAEILPTSSLPNLYGLIDRVPLTSNGKVDRDTLVELARAKLDTRSRATLPESPLEETLLQIAREATGLTDLGVEDDLLLTGLSSMGMVQMQVRLARQLGRNIEPVNMFVHHTVRKAARFVRSTATFDTHAIHADV